MSDKALYKKMSEFGYTLFDFDLPAVESANETVAALVMSSNPRLLQGFAVVLADSAQKGLFNFDLAKGKLRTTKDLKKFGSLLAMALALYKSMGLAFSWSSTLLKKLSPNVKNEYDKFCEAYKKNGRLSVGDLVFDSQKIKSVFENYHNQKEAALGELLSRKEELSLEFALSQVFSPKQKELFLKKLKNEKMTKTEKEYFSRAVRKKVLALANPQLNRLSQKLLE